MTKLSIEVMRARLCRPWILVSLGMVLGISTIVLVRINRNNSVPTSSLPDRKETKEPRLSERAHSADVPTALGYQIGGQVVDDSGNTVSDAQVKIQHVGSNHVQTALADAEGIFRFTGLREGNYDITCRADRYVEQRRPLLVQAGVDSERSIDCKLHRGIVLSGQVLFGIMPIPNAQLFVRNSEAVVSAVSNAQGRFTVVLESAGELEFGVTGMDVLAPIGIRVSRDTANVLVAVGSPALIRGTVFANGYPASGAKVTFEIGEPLVSWTDQFGRYQSPPLPAGTYRVWAESADSRSASFQKTITLEKNDKREGFELDLTRGAEVGGTVVDDSGAPVPGVSIVFHRHDGREDGFARTDLLGRYLVQRLSIGEHTAIVKAEGDETTLVYVNPGGSAPPQIRITRADQKIENFNLVVTTEKSRLRGRVVDENGLPIVGAEIAVQSLEEGADIDDTGATRSTSRADGTFESRPLPPGRYDVRAMTTIGTASTSLKHPGGTALLTISARGTLSGTLEGFHSTPNIEVSGVRQTVEGNRFFVDAVPRGKAVVTAVAGDEIAVQIVEIQPPMAATVALRPMPLAAMNVTVLNVKPSDRAWCRWAIAGLEKSFPLDVSGRFSVALPVGQRVAINCQHPHGTGKAELQALAEGGTDVIVEMNRHDE